MVTNWEESGGSLFQGNIVVAELRKNKRKPVGTANNKAKNAISIGPTN